MLQILRTEFTFGTNAGSIIMIDSANTAYPTSQRISEMAPVSISSIAVEDGNEDHIVVTYSNYGSPRFLKQRMEVPTG
ncbi:MAG: hypothetical protein IPI60_06100 [Saprospiraceae bacterium]|nr:hypothetical protein [Saprospiraceae bacterium]